MSWLGISNIVHVPMRCRAHKEALEQLVAKRKEDQEAQRKKIEEEKRKLKEAFDTAVKIIQMLEGPLLVFSLSSLPCVLSYSRPLFTCVYSCRIACLRFGPFLRPILVTLACVLTPVLVHLMGSTLCQPLIPPFPRSPDSSVDLGKLYFAQLSHCLADQKAAGCLHSAGKYI
jgi:hypothetical protein